MQRDINQGATNARFIILLITRDQRTAVTNTTEIQTENFIAEQRTTSVAYPEILEQNHKRLRGTDVQAMTAYHINHK